MKKHFIIKSIFVLGILFTFGSLTSCKKEGCTDSVAENFDSKAKEDDGSCVYPREKFFGSYSVTESCSSGSYSYNISVAESSTGKTFLIINNFGDYGVNITATVSGSTISFNETKSGINFSGQGSISGSALTISYTASAGGATDVCTMNCIKQ